MPSGFQYAIGFDAIQAHEAALTEHAIARLSGVRGLRLLGVHRAGGRRQRGHYQNWRGHAHQELTNSQTHLASHKRDGL